MINQNKQIIFNRLRLDKMQNIGKIEGIRKDTVLKEVKIAGVYYNN